MVLVHEDCLKQDAARSARDSKTCCMDAVYRELGLEARKLELGCVRCRRRLSRPGLSPLPHVKPFVDMDVLSSS